MMIALQCYYGTKMELASQKMLATSFIIMSALCMANLFVYPTGPMPPPPAVAYLTIVPATYVKALMDAGKSKKK